MKRKGFTLIELLAVIIVIGLISLIAIPMVVGNISETKKSAYQTQVQNIEIATRKWATEHVEFLDDEYLNASYVSVKMLQDLGYLSKDSIKNPMTGETMEGCIGVVYDSADKSYKYSYNDENKTCTNQEAAGFYYRFDETNKTWEKDETKAQKSIYSYILERGVVVSGSGLYDMEDRYVFRGEGVTNNYVKINGESTLWKILSLDKTTKSIKIIQVSGSGGSNQWHDPKVSDNFVDFQEASIHTKNLDVTTYSTIINPNVKWNIGKIEVIDNINMDAARTYEKKTQITSNIGLISMSEYMEASLDDNCISGTLSSCGNNNYLDLTGAWTLTKAGNSVLYINDNGGLDYEYDIYQFHDIHNVINVGTIEQKGNGSQDNPFQITI